MLGTRDAAQAQLSRYWRNRVRVNFSENQEAKVRNPISLIPRDTAEYQRDRALIDGFLSESERTAHSLEIAHLFLGF